MGALLRGLTTELIRHGRIKTTTIRCKELRKTADHMVQLAKGGSLHERRQALGYIYDKSLVHALFEQAPERYGERNGGYTRVLSDGFRRGDNAACPRSSSSKQLPPLDEASAAHPS